MPRWIRLDKLTEVGVEAIERALSGQALPERRVAITAGFEGNVAAIEYVLPGKRPEDGVVLARARLERSTGTVISVETFESGVGEGEPIESSDVNGGVCVSERPMTKAGPWRRRWFGFWYEDGAEFSDCPSLADWMDPAWSGGGHLDKIVRYLEGGACVWAESPPTKCLICALPLGDRAGYRTDGVWYWPGSLVHQIEAHHVKVPMELETWIMEPPRKTRANLWRSENDFVYTLRHLEVPDAHRGTIQHFIKLREE